MKIRESKKLEKNVTSLVVFRRNKEISRHPLVRLMGETDKKFISIFASKASLSENDAKVIITPSGKKAILVRIPKEFNFRKARLLMRKVVSVARSDKSEKVQINLKDIVVEPLSPQDSAQMLGLQTEIANFEFVDYKSDKSKAFFVKEIIVYNPRGLAIKKELRAGKVIGEEVNNSRILANTPGGDMTPTLLATKAKAAGKKNNFKVKVLGDKEIKRLKMGGVLGVSQGSDARPRFIIMEHMKGRKGERPVVLVGKGITFDTGGLNLKPTSGIYEMHMDMSGGAAVIHTMSVLARLGIKKNVIGLVPAAENMVSGSSYRPGDVLTTMSGKTIEVLNTDAEGRLVMADAFEYAKKYKPKFVADVATLTGASMVALGQRASALFATDEQLQDAFIEAGERSGDYVWPLPLWEEYEEEIKGTFGDVANSGKYEKYGGAITAAIFLWQFIKGHKWVHVDIAPRMTSINGDYLAKGSAGAGVALLVEVLSSKNI